jgi:hypothetical protein
MHDSIGIVNSLSIGEKAYHKYIEPKLRYDENDTFGSVDVADGRGNGRIFPLAIKFVCNGYYPLQSFPLCVFPPRNPSTKIPLNLLRTARV